MLPSCYIERRFHFKHSGEKDVHLYADDESIEQKIINLKSNTFKYAGDSSIILVKVEKSKEVSRISGCDTPPGELLLVELEDLNPYLSLLQLPDDLRDQFLWSFHVSIGKAIETNLSVLINTTIS